MNQVKDLERSDSCPKRLHNWSNKVQFLTDAFVPRRRQAFTGRFNISVMTLQSPNISESSRIFFLSRFLRKDNFEPSPEEVVETGISYWKLKYFSISLGFKLYLVENNRSGFLF